MANQNPNAVPPLSRLSSFQTDQSNSDLLPLDYDDENYIDSDGEQDVDCDEDGNQLNFVIPGLNCVRTAVCSAANNNNNHSQQTTSFQSLLNSQQNSQTTHHSNDNDNNNNNNDNVNNLRLIENTLNNINHNIIIGNFSNDINNNNNNNSHNNNNQQSQNLSQNSNNNNNSNVTTNNDNSHQTSNDNNNNSNNDNKKTEQQKEDPILCEEQEIFFKDLCSALSVQLNPKSRLPQKHDVSPNFSKIYKVLKSIHEFAIINNYGCQLLQAILKMQVPPSALKRVKNRKCNLVDVVLQRGYSSSHTLFAVFFFFFV